MYIITQFKKSLGEVKVSGGLTYLLLDVILDFAEDESVNELPDSGDGVFRCVPTDGEYCVNCDCGLGGTYMGDI